MASEWDMECRIDGQLNNYFPCFFHKGVEFEVLCALIDDSEVGFARGKMPMMEYLGGYSEMGRGLFAISRDSDFRRPSV